MKNILIIISFLWGISSVQAQTTNEELLEFPESMQSDMDSLFWDWQSKNYITIDENCRMLPEYSVSQRSDHFPRSSSSAGTISVL